MGNVFPVQRLCSCRPAPCPQLHIVLNCNVLEIISSHLAVNATFCFALHPDRSWPGRQGCDFTSRSKSDCEELHRRKGTECSNVLDMECHHADAPASALSLSLPGARQCRTDTVIHCEALENNKCTTSAVDDEVNGY